MTCECIESSCLSSCSTQQSTSTEHQFEVDAVCRPQHITTRSSQTLSFSTSNSSNFCDIYWSSTSHLLTDTTVTILPTSVIPSSFFQFPTRHRSSFGIYPLISIYILTIMLSMTNAEQSSSLLHQLQHAHTSSHAKTCTRENSICSENSATICKNETCVSACSLRGMQECQCDVEEDNYCYLCCGNANHQCMPAHHHNILRPNGERWEREACSRCRMHGAELEGLPCDDTDSARLCIGGKCSNSVCHTKQPGSYCDRKLEKLCVDNTCENPCARFASHLMVCDCPAIDQDTGFASEDRCQLCCYDFNLKPANRRCQNAYRKYKIMDQFQKPIFRVGIDCAGGKTCNKYGVCSASSISLMPLSFLLAIIYGLRYI